MQYSQKVIIKRWIPILKEYELTKAKVNPRPFKFVKYLCQAHSISKKEPDRYYGKWIEGNKQPESLTPNKLGPKLEARRTPRYIERNIIKTYCRLGSNLYEIVLLFKPHYMDKTPTPTTVDKIKRTF
ncbi:MAG: hypothetical protein ACE5KZ_03285 [Candidatus Scalinduaceae bacterium]